MVHEKKEIGWVIVAPDGFIADFTYKRTRRESIKRWCDLWSKPTNWRGHYRKGYRAVKCTRIIQIKN